nr:hypothetical protein [Tanacetum cinerariifolium]
FRRTQKGSLPSDLSDPLSHSPSRVTHHLVTTQPPPPVHRSTTAHRHYHHPHHHHRPTIYITTPLPTPQPTVTVTPPHRDHAHRRHHHHHTVGVVGLWFLLTAELGGVRLETAARGGFGFAAVQQQGAAVQQQGVFVLGFLTRGVWLPYSSKGCLFLGLTAPRGAFVSRDSSNSWGFSSSVRSKRVRLVVNNHKGVFVLGWSAI